MAKKIADYLDGQASSLLEDEPFKNWSVEKSFEDDLEDPIVQYVFRQYGFALRCDWDEKINTIFLSPDSLSGFDENLLDVAFSWSRRQVLEHLGTPSKSGEKMNDPILGEYGAWDRFALPGYAVHVEYQINFDGIQKITLMREDAVPYAAFP